MLCSFTNRFHNFIWFLIFTFTLYCMPHLEMLLPYRLNLFLPGAEAAEAQPEDTSSKGPQSDETEVIDSQAPSAPEGAAAASSSGSGELGAQIAPVPSFKVDDFTGSAHMSYPIAVPPGRGGLAPQLSLNYSSALGNGWLGVGWDLSMGYIQRRGPRKGVPKYDDTKDVYELNLGGSTQDLVPIAPGSNEYRLRIEGAYLKIIYQSSQNYWEVWDKSGAKMRFGYNNSGSTGSRVGKIPNPATKNQTYRWCLDRVDDPNTNYMEINYFIDQGGTGITDGNQIYIEKIRYNGNVAGAIPPNHEIIFNRELSERPDPIYDYRGGFKILTKRRLSSIEVRTNETLVRRYQLHKEQLLGFSLHIWHQGRCD
jgi:hypothetical protein